MGKLIDEEAALRVALVGDVLAPLFLLDPASDEGSPLLREIAGIDVCEAAREWPFAGERAALPCFETMKRGALDIPIDETSREYRRLFVGPAALPCPPWGSVYLDRDCVMFGESTLALRSWMRERGIAPFQSNREPDDHIGTLLMLMSWLAREMPEELGDFLSLHLLTWAPHYLGLLQESTGHPFYRGLALLASQTLVALKSALDLEVSLPRFYR